MILQNDFKRQWEFLEAPALDAVRRVGESGWYILGREVEAFEEALAKFWGVAPGTRLQSNNSPIIHESYVACS